MLTKEEYRAWYQRLKADPDRYRSRLARNQVNRRTARERRAPQGGWDMRGKVFGRLTVLRYTRRDAKRNRYWECKCECGRKHEVLGDRLRACLTVECRSCAGYRARYGRVPEGLSDVRDFQADQDLRRRKHVASSSIAL